MTDGGGLRGGQTQPRGLSHKVLPQTLLPQEAKGIGHDVSFRVNVLGLTLAPTGKEERGEGTGHMEADVNTGLVILEENGACHS